MFLSFTLFFIIWYIYMSCIDWIVHKYILHADDSLLPEWRRLHKLHHLEYDKTMDKHGQGLGFTYLDMLLIAFISIIPVLLITAFINLDYVPFILLFHFVGTCIGVGMHNHGHRLFHEHDELPGCMQVPYPEIYRNFIHEHHTHHHINAMQNYCTIFLGFDFFTGTSHYQLKN